MRWEKNNKWFEVWAIDSNAPRVEFIDYAWVDGRKMRRWLGAVSGLGRGIELAAVMS